MKTNRQPVLITGASSGIGRATAQHLARLGFRVFAGVRRESDARELKAESGGTLEPLFLDVADGGSIAAAVDVVRQETDGSLAGLVNNAGLSLNGPLELVPVPEMRKLMEVNVVGLMAVTQAFIPFLREARGRIVNVSSGHGLLAVPDKSVYAASKFAVQAVSDALRTELWPFGVSVSSLVVGKVDTEVLGKILEDRDAMLAASPQEVVELYAPLFEFFDREVKTIPGIGPEEVGKVIAEALTARKPRAQYLIGPGAKKMKNLARIPRGLRERMMFQAIYGRRRK